VSLIVRDARISDVEDIARAEVETWRDTYATLLPDTYLVDTLDVTRCIRNWRHRLRRRARDRTIVASPRISGHIVGYATFGPTRADTLPYCGQLYELYLLSDYRGLGIGRRLCATVAERLLQAGVLSMCVEVLEGNPSRFFYEALGGRIAARTEHPFAGRNLPALIYAWEDLATLVGARAD